MFQNADGKILQSIALLSMVAIGHWGFEAQGIGCVSLSSASSGGLIKMYSLLKAAEKCSPGSSR